MKVGGRFQSLPAHDSPAGGPRTSIAAEHLNVNEAGAPKASDEHAKSVLEELGFRPLARNTLRGFATAYVAQMRLAIRDVAIHQKGDQRWAQLPSRPHGQGRPRDPQRRQDRHATLFEFDDRPTRDAFSAAVIAAVLERDPAALRAAHEIAALDRS